jgi:hypothetical protein
MANAYSHKEFLAFVILNKHRTESSCLPQLNSHSRRQGEDVEWNTNMPEKCSAIR